MSPGCDGGTGGGSAAPHPSCARVHVLAMTLWFRQALAPGMQDGAHGICLDPYKLRADWRLSQNMTFMSS